MIWVRNNFLLILGRTSLQSVVLWDFLIRNPIKTFVLDFFVPEVEFVRWNVLLHVLFIGQTPCWFDPHFLGTLHENSVSWFALGIGIKSFYFFVIVILFIWLPQNLRLFDRALAPWLNTLCVVSRSYLFFLNCKVQINLFSWFCRYNLPFFLKIFWYVVNFLFYFGHFLN